MPSIILDAISRWRVALTVFCLAGLSAGVVFRIATARGPSWLFFAVSAGVLALVVIDTWDQLRAVRAAGRNARQGPMPLLPTQPADLEGVPCAS